MPIVAISTVSLHKRMQWLWTVLLLIESRELIDEFPPPSVFSTKRTWERESRAWKLAVLGGERLSTILAKSREQA